LVASSCDPVRGKPGGNRQHQTSPHMLPLRARPGGASNWQLHSLKHILPFPPAIRRGRIEGGKRGRSSGARLVASSCDPVRGKPGGNRQHQTSPHMLPLRACPGGATTDSYHTKPQHTMLPLRARPGGASNWQLPRQTSTHMLPLRAWRLSFY
jgi:hypothetical protein